MADSFHLLIFLIDYSMYRPCMHMVLFMYVYGAGQTTLVGGNAEKNKINQMKSITSHDD